MMPSFGIRKQIPVSWKYFLSTLSICLVAAGYFYLSYKQHLVNSRDTTLPNLTQLIAGFEKIIEADSSGKVWLFEDMKATYARHFTGLAFGVVISLILGLAMGCWAVFEASFLPILSFFAKIPPTAMMTVYFVMFGMEFEMFAAVVALGVAPILSQTIYQSVQKDVSDYEIDKAYTLGASHAEVIWEIIYRKIRPRFIEAVRLQAGPALVFLIAAEMLVADVGFGYRLRIQGRLLNMNVVYIYLVILGITYHVIDWTITSYRRLRDPWFGV